MRLFGSLVLWLITLVAAMFTYYGVALAQLARDAWLGVAVSGLLTLGFGAAAWFVSFGVGGADRRVRREDRLDLDDEGAGPPR